MRMALFSPEKNIKVIHDGCLFKNLIIEQAHLELTLIRMYMCLYFNCGVNLSLECMRLLKIICRIKCVISTPTPKLDFTFIHEIKTSYMGCVCGAEECQDGYQKDLSDWYLKLILPYITFSHIPLGFACPR